MKLSFYICWHIFVHSIYICKVIHLNHGTWKNLSSEGMLSTTDAGVVPFFYLEKKT